MPNELHWDNTNKRLGIGTTTPGYTLTVNGDIYGTRVYNAVWNDIAEIRE